MIESLFSDPTYTASKVLLDATAVRQEALASNIANAETPGYRRVDLAKSFNETFAAQVKAGQVGQIPRPTIEQDPNIGSMREDGNNVQIDKELMAMGANSTQYDTLTEFVSQSLKQLQIAVTGKSA